MTGPAEAAKDGVEIAKRHIFDQIRRIEQQRALIGKLERDDLHDRLPGARRLLSDMERTLAERSEPHAIAQRADLAAALRGLGYSQSRIAERLGVPQQLVSRILQGCHN